MTTPSGRVNLAQLIELFERNGWRPRKKLHGIQGFRFCMFDRVRKESGSANTKGRGAHREPWRVRLEEDDGLSRERYNEIKKELEG